MAGLMTKARLKNILLTLEPLTEESEVIDAWGDAWSQFFEVAAAESTVANPSYITDETTVLKIGVDSLLGTGDNTGTNVLVTCISTGEIENLVSQFDTANFIRTTGLLGQSSVSTTLTDYEVYLTGLGIEVSALSVAKAALKDALDGLSGSNAAAEKLFDGLIAWWADLQAKPTNYFPTASAIIPPTALSTLQADLQSTFDDNNADIESLGTLTSDQALDRIAQTLVDGNSGGILEEPGVPNPQQYTIG